MERGPGVTGCDGEQQQSAPKPNSRGGGGQFKLRAMDAGKRAEMISQLVAFLGCFLAELLRAINLSQLFPDGPEIVEDDESTLVQTGKNLALRDAGDESSLVQNFDPRVPFGSKLAQLQAHLNGFDETQCMQVVSHLHVMIRRLRQLAGTTTAKGQLQTLIPYLNGGRTPECEGMEGPGLGVALPASAAASSTDIVEVVNSSEGVVIPEYRVLNPDGNWVAASEEQAEEFRAHDLAVQRESQLQEEANRTAFEEFEARMAQRWDDWAVSSEMNKPSLPEPSKKRIRVTVCVGAACGRDLGETVIEGVVNHDDTAAVTFNVVETLLGTPSHTGPSSGHSFVSAQAAPQLADFDRAHLPGLAEHVVDFMLTVEGRHWLWQYSVDAVTSAEIEERFGAEIAEAFQLWVALKEDLDKTVRNVGAEPLLAVQRNHNASEAFYRNG